MADGFVHTVFKGGQWINELEGGAGFGGPHSTKEAAVAAGRTHAQQEQAEHVIHNQTARSVNGTRMETIHLQPRLIAMGIRPASSSSRNSS